MAQRPVPWLDGCTIVYVQRIFVGKEEKEKAKKSRAPCQKMSALRGLTLSDQFGSTFRDKKMF